MRKTQIFNKILSRCEKIYSKNRFNLLRTLYINFRLFPFKIAIKTPIYIYGKVTYVSLAGTAEITGTIKRGMIIFGKNDDKFYASHRCALIVLPISTKIIFEGNTFIGQDFTIRLSENGMIRLGKNIRIMSGIKLCSETYIHIKDHTVISFDCQILDTNFHYTINDITNDVKRKSFPIEIGSFNWIGNRCTITKGTKTTNHTIVASGSLLNKDYLIENKNSNEPILLAGIPASIKANNQKLIYFDSNLENKLNIFFREHPKASSINILNLQFEQHG